MPPLITLEQFDGKVFVEAIPGTLSYVATVTAWNALSTEGKMACVREVYNRLGVPVPTDQEVP